MFPVPPGLQSSPLHTEVRSEVLLTPALLRHKESAQSIGGHAFRNRVPLIDPFSACHKDIVKAWCRGLWVPSSVSLWQHTPIEGYFACSSLVLYGIRIVGFHARKGPILGALMS